MRKGFVLYGAKPFALSSSESSKLERRSDCLKKGVRNSEGTAGDGCTTTS